MAVTFVPSPTLVAQIYVEPSIGVSMMALGAEGVEIAKRLAPVGPEPPHLVDTIRVDPIPGNGARISVNIDYWNFPEYGTSDPDYPKQPYLRPTLTELGVNLT